MKTMNEALIKEGEALGINTSMYYLLPANKRERALKLDIEKRRKEEKDEHLKSQKEQPDES